MNPKWTLVTVVGIIGFLYCGYFGLVKQEVTVYRKGKQQYVNGVRKPNAVYTGTTAMILGGIGMAVAAGITALGIVQMKQTKPSPRP